MVTSPAVEILQRLRRSSPQALTLSKARLNRFSRCSPREQNPGYSKYHWWNSEVNTCRELPFRHANSAVVFTGRRGNLTGMNRPNARALGFAVVFLLVMQVFSVAQDQVWAKRVADAAILRWPEGKVARGNEKLSDWAYDKSVLFSGLIQVSRLTSDERYLAYVERALDRLVGPDGTIASYKPNELSLDELALGRQVLFLYEREHKAKYYKAAQMLRHQLDLQPRTPSGGFWHKQRYPNQMWLDGLYMAEPFYAQYSAMFHDKKAFDDIAHQFILVEEHTRDPKTGLLYHAWDESRQQKWADKTTGDSPNFWSRAMGWYAMALVDTLPYFPKDHPGRAQLIAILGRLADTIAKYQDQQTGLWYQVTDRAGAPGNYLESSAACMFTYALAKGVRLGYLDSKYRANASRAYQGILHRFVRQDASGRWTLIDTVYSAGLGGTPYRDGSFEYYIHEKAGPDDPKGIGAFLLASSEMEQVRNSR